MHSIYDRQISSGQSDGVDTSCSVQPQSTLLRIVIRQLLRSLSVRQTCGPHSDFSSLCAQKALSFFHLSAADFDAHADRHSPTRGQPPGSLIDVQQLRTAC